MRMTDALPHTHDASVDGSAIGAERPAIEPTILSERVDRGSINGVGE
jgi:hypothetical protein